MVCVQLACLGLLVLGRVVNFLLPVTLGKLIETLTDKSGSPWTYLLVFVALRYLQSSGGIGAVRDVRTFLFEIITSSSSSSIW